MTLAGPIPEFLEFSMKHQVICLGTHLLATARIIKVNIPYAHRIIKVRSFLNVASGAGALVATLKDDAGVAFTGGVLTIAASSGVDTEDVSTDITAGTQTQAKDKVVQLDMDGGTASGEAIIWLELEHTDP